MMKTWIDFFLARPLLVNLFTILVLIIGGFFAWSLQKEIFPKVEFGVIQITTVYPGSSAEDVEKLVTIEIERKLKEVSGIDTMDALSLEGMSLFIIKVDQDFDLDDVYNDVKNAVDTVDDLPEDAEAPIIRSFDNKTRGIIKVALKGDDYKHLRVVSKDLRDYLERMREISTIELEGYRVDEIRIEMDPKKLNDYQVTVGEVHKAVKERNLNLSAGKIESRGGDLFVRTLAEFQNLDDIRNVVVRSNNSGEKVKVSDIAEIIRQPAEGEVLQRSNGQPAIFLDVKIKEQADILKSTDKLKVNLKEYYERKADLVKGTTYHYADDASYWVKRRLNILKDNGILGMILVFLCLLAFLNFRSSLVTSMGAPIAFMISFILMHVFGITINMISMFALIMVLGMLVDDSIIVAEYYFQKLEKGLSRKEAARQAAFETVAPVSATIFTTMVAFAAFFFMGGTMGKFIWSIPAVIIICLGASLLECYFILPSHLADFVKVGEDHNKKKWYDFQLAFYGKSLKLFLKWWWAILLAFFLIFIGALFTAKTMRLELFPGDDVRTVYMQIKGKVGSSRDRTDVIMKRMEKIALEQIRPEELDQIKAQVGVLQETNRRKTGSHYGSLVVYLTPPQDRERSTDDIIDDLSEKMRPHLDEYVLTNIKQRGGPPRGKPVDIELSGDNLEELLVVAKKIEKELSKVNGVTTSEIDFEEGKKQVAIHVDDAEAMRLGLSTQQVALELRRAFSGDGFTEIRESDEDIEIKLFLDEEARSRVETLNMLFITNNQGRRIPLNKVIKTESQEAAFVIRRKDRKRVVSVIADLNFKIINPKMVAKTFEPTVKKILEDHPSIYYDFGGENKDTNESVQNLFKAFIISIVCIFLILVVMFGSLLQSLVVMSAIPLGIIGVVITFKIAGAPLSFMALLGVVALVGVVVNDSIVLVNFINKHREETDNLVQAVYEASLSRFRAVVLTTVTTVAGLLPIAHPFLSKILSFGMNTDSDPFLQPMAMSFAWGLLFASVITLVFIPANYLFADKIHTFGMKIWKKVVGNVDSGTSSEGSEQSPTTSA